MLYKIHPWMLWGTSSVTFLKSPGFLGHNQRESSNIVEVFTPCWLRALGSEWVSLTDCGYVLVSLIHLATLQWHANIKLTTSIESPKPHRQHPALAVYLLYNLGTETAEPVTDNVNLQKTKNNSTHGDSYMGLRDCYLMDCATAVPDHKLWPSGK